MGQLVDLITLAKINLFEPRFKSYDHETWQSSKALLDSVEIRFKTFTVKKTKICLFLYKQYSGPLKHKFRGPKYGF